MPYQVPSSNNTIIPTTAATDGMIIGYSRNPKSAALNRYAGMKPVPLTAGLYLRIDPSNAARFRDPSGADSVWAPGADRPSGLRNANRFEFAEYQTTRHNESVQTDLLAIQQAEWAVEDADAQLVASKIMNLRIGKALTALSSANLPTIDAGTICGTGQHMGNGTETNPNIKKVFTYVGRAINKATFGAIKPSDIVAVFNPDSAAQMSLSPEVQAAFVRSQFAYGQLTGSDANLNADWYLPPSLYTMNLEIEDWVFNTAKEYSSASANYALPTGDIYFLARPDGLVSREDKLPSDSNPEGSYYGVKNTLMGFYKEEMTVEAKQDEWNRQVIASVTTNFQYQVTSLLSGFRVTNAFTPGA